MPPLAPIGEGVSTAADVGNIAMDVYRSNPEQAKSMAKQAVNRISFYSHLTVIYEQRLSRPTGRF